MFVQLKSQFVEIVVNKVISKRHISFYRMLTVKKKSNTNHIHNVNIRTVDDVEGIDYNSNPDSKFVNDISNYMFIGHIQSHDVINIDD